MNTLITMYIHTCVLTKCGISSSKLIHVYKYSNVLLMNDYKCLYSCVV